MTTRDAWREDARAAMAVLLADHLKGSAGEWPTGWDMEKMAEVAAKAADWLMAEAKKRTFYPNLGQEDAP